MNLFSNRKQKARELDSLPDEQLAVRYRLKGDMDCLGILFQRYTHLIFPVCLKYLGNEEEAEDMVMLIFEKLLEELKHTEVHNFKGWLYQVTRNQCLMALRHRGTIERNKKEILRDLEYELMEIGPDMHHLPGNNGSDETGRLLSAMEQLGESQRKCIELFYLEEISYKEVSIMTGLSMNEVKSHIQNGKRNLRIILEKDRK